MPAPIETAQSMMGAAAPLSQLRFVAMVALLLSLSTVEASAATAESSVTSNAQRLRISKVAPASNPFKLTIHRADYRIDLGSPTAKSGKRAAVDRPFVPEIERHSRVNGLDPALVHAVIRAESAYRPDALSPKGAVGLMQVMPETGKRFGVASNLDHPDDNLKAGTAYLKHLLDRFSNLPLALAAYNAGEGAVMRYGRQIPPYPETEGYVRNILRDYGEVAVARKESTPLPRAYSEGLRLSADLSGYRLMNLPVHLTEQ